MNLRIDPASPEFNRIIELVEAGDLSKAKTEMYRVFQKQIPFVRDPVKLEHVFNRFVDLINKKVLALGILGLRLYLLQTDFNESAKYEVIQAWGEELKEVDAEKREFFLEQLEALGIDPKVDSEAYREVYRQCFGKEPPR